jgi:hypothetical protein
MLLAGVQPLGFLARFVFYSPPLVQGLALQKGMEVRHMRKRRGENIPATAADLFFLEGCVCPPPRP